MDLCSDLSRTKISPNQACDETAKDSTQMGNTAGCNCDRALSMLADTSSVCGCHRLVSHSGDHFLSSASATRQEHKACFAERPHLGRARRADYLDPRSY